MPEKKITLYSTQFCPKCKKLKSFLTANSIQFDTADMSTPEALTELRFNQCFTMTAPVLQIGDVFYTHEELFKGGEINDKLVKYFQTKNIVGE